MDQYFINHHLVDQGPKKHGRPAPLSSLLSNITFDDIKLPPELNVPSETVHLVLDRLRTTVDHVTELEKRVEYMEYRVTEGRVLDRVETIINKITWIDDGGPGPVDKTWMSQEESLMRYEEQRRRRTRRGTLSRRSRTEGSDKS